jgi:pimeloyl-ACP methyl ester carboxylesterase
MKVLRTPEDRFADLPGFGYPPRYADVGGLRLACVEAGPPSGEPVLLLHGEPSWSFLHRKVMPVLVDAGLRAIAADLVITGAGHFLQDDAGERLGAVIADFVRANPVGDDCPA